MMNLLEGAALFTRMGLAYEAGIHEALEMGCEIVEAEAKHVIGTYEYGWRQLADSTQQQRVSLGYSANEPLLRTGELRDSIEHTIEGKSGFVGSDNDKAVWQELGTSRGIPPRSFLLGAAMRKAHEVAHAIGYTQFERMNGRKGSIGGVSIGPL